MNELRGIGLDVGDVPTQAFVGGEWRRAQDTFPVLSPVTGEVVARISDCGPCLASEAVLLASEAFRSWRERTVFERAEVLRRWARLIEDHSDTLGCLVTLEMGKPIKEAIGEVVGAARAVEWTAQEACRVHGELLPSEAAGRWLYVHRRPVGVVFGITPWNFPVSMVTRKAAPALAVGCAFILKPSEETPLAALFLARLWAEAGGPPGTLQVLPTVDPAPLAAAVIADARVAKLTFTGSTAVGRALNEAAARTLKRVSLELGGHAPLIVFADADIQAAAKGAVVAKYRNGGQTCISANRVYVEERVGGPFLEALAEETSRLVVGDPFDERTEVGPLVNRQAVEKVRSHVADALSAGARLVCGGDGDGLYFSPTVVADVNARMLVMCQETFGPVAPVASFVNDDEAISLANGTPYGLAAYFWTRDAKRITNVIEKLEFGIVGVNDARPLQFHVPFGGVKDSGLGREGGRWGVDEYLEVSYAGINWQ